MEDHHERQSQFREDQQPSIMKEHSGDAVPSSLAAPIDTSSDFYNTPLTGHTPVYPSATTTSESTKNMTNTETGNASAPGIPGLSIQDDTATKKPLEEIRPAVSAEGQHLETQAASNTASEVESVPQTMQLNDGSGTTDAMDTGETAIDQPMTTEEEHPEWEVDSSPYESSSDSSTDSSDDSDDSDEDKEDYPILSAEETARILMQAEGGSDDEGDTKTGGGSQLRTANERVEDAPPIPDIVITPDLKIVPLGHLESIVENIILIRATVSGDYQVLESNSLLCLEDRTVIGVVADTLGRVEEPLYTVRYQDPAKIQEFGLENGKQVYYVESHSEFVFTQPLKGLKGSDASNFHDEEVAEDEIEFSDDEAEADYKRRLKQKKKEKRENRGDSGAFGGKPRNVTGPSPLGRTELNYDDDGDRVEEGYTPLARPKNYHEMMNQQDTHMETSSTSNNRGNFRGRGRGRGGFDRGSGRGRGNDRRGKGNYHHNQSQDSNHRSDYSRDSPAASQYPHFSTPQTAFPTQQAFPAQQYAQYPSFPQQTQTTQQQPQFMPFGQGQTAGMPQFPFQMPYQQNPYPNLPAGAHINPAFFAALQQHHQQQQQGQQQQQQQQGSVPQIAQNQAGPNNQTAFSQVQAQLDILRQLTGAGGALPPSNPPR